MKDSPNPQEKAGSLESEPRDSNVGTSKSNSNVQDTDKGLPSDPGVIAGETVEQVGASTGEYPSEPPATRVDTSGRSAFFVGAGILISRIVGLIRQRIFAHYFGSSGAAETIPSEVKIPSMRRSITKRMPSPKPAAPSRAAGRL